MSKQKTKNIQPTKKEKAIKRLDVFNDVPRYVKGIILVALLLTLVWFLFLRNAERYGTDAIEVQDRIQAALQTELPGKQLASNITDQGCNSGTSVGLQTRIECSMKGYKYIQVTGDKKAALRITDAKLESLGFRKDINNTYTHRVLDGIEEGDISYVNKYATAKLGWSILPSISANGPNSGVISDALSSHQLDTPHDEVIVIGVLISENYWACSSGGLDIWGLTCAFPPHLPNK